MPWWMILSVVACTGGPGGPSPHEGTWVRTAQLLTLDAGVESQWCLLADETLVLESDGIWWWTSDAVFDEEGAGCEGQDLEGSTITLGGTYQRVYVGDQGAYLLAFDVDEDRRDDWTSSVAWGGDLDDRWLYLSWFGVFQSAVDAP